MTADLIARLEAAPEGSEQLDVAIARAYFGYKADDPLWHVMPYSRSLDAAMTLTPYSGLVYWTIGRFAVQGELSIRTKIWPPGPAPGPNEGWDGKAATPALSFSAAALRARGET